MSLHYAERLFSMVGQFTYFEHGVVKRERRAGELLSCSGGVLKVDKL